MTNNGFQVATVAYRVSRPGGLALDINGDLCSESGNRQAIRLLTGEVNPDPDRYDVAGYFDSESELDGVPIRIFNPSACPVSLVPDLPVYRKYPIVKKFIEIDPSYDSNEEGYYLFSKDWDTALSASPTDVGNDLTMGGYNRGTYPTRRIGEYEWTLENWRMVYNPGRDYERRGYYINQEILRNSGVGLSESDSAYMNGCYTASNLATDLLPKGLGVFDLSDRPVVNSNLFVGNKFMDNFDVDGNNRIYRNPNAVSFWFIASQNRSYTVHRKGSTSKFAWYRSWANSKGEIAEGSVVTLGMDHSDMDTFSAYTQNAFLAILIVVSDDGSSVEKLQDIIKIEEGDVYTGWVDPKDKLKEKGWSLPCKPDFEQLLGMVGMDFSISNLKRNLFVSPTDVDIPWLSDWDGADLCEDLLGMRLTPSGLRPPNGNIVGFGDLCGLALSGGYTDVAPTVWLEGADNGIGNIVCDSMDVSVPLEQSRQLWQRHLRFCRVLTDEELGYRLWRDDVNDMIHVTSLDAIQPVDSTELEKGLLRGMAVRWLDSQIKPTRVIVSLNFLLREIDKTLDNGDYGWMGWH